MEARRICPIVGMATIVCLGLSSTASAQLFRAREHVAHSQNFIVFASSPQWAAQVAQVAEQNRRDLAVHWFGEELPPWSERCPIHVHSGPNRGAAGETRYSLLPHGAGNWLMIVNGTPERVLDSVLPHEITHTLFATHFAHLGKYVPRWADEGACTTVEHESEKRKHAYHLQKFLRRGRGLAFNQMFNLKEYPQDILPLYAQGHSAVQFLLDQGGPRKFVEFIETGMRSDAWTQALSEHYAYESIGQFQTLWNQWLADGSPVDLANYAPGLQQNPGVLLASSSGNSELDGKVQFAIGNTKPAPVSLASNSHRSHNSSDPVALSGAESYPSVQHLGSENWYKRKLREVSGANAVPSSSVLPAPKGLQSPMPAPMQSTARPMQVQSTAVQVLDWGRSVPVHGIQSARQNPIKMVPIYR